MRRIVPSFTVEVRRRPRLATNSSQGVQSLEAKTRPTAFEREVYRVAAATFEAKTSNQPSSDGAASHPKRRILESLRPRAAARWSAPRRVIVRCNVESKIARAETAVGARTKGKDQTSKAPQDLESSSDLKAQIGGKTFGCVRSTDRHVAE